MNAKLALALVAANAIGFFYGIYYYWDQLAQTPLWLWIFVIDCPLYAGLVAIVLALMLLKKKSPLLSFITSVGAFKYGIWTMFVILFYGEVFLRPELLPTYAMLFFAHFGLMLEGIFLMGEIDEKSRKYLKKFAAISLLWFGLNDAVDYGIGTYPNAVPFGGAKFAALVVFTAAMTIISTALFYWGSKKKWNPLAVLKK